MTQTTRPVQLDDLDLVCRHREDMFASSGHNRDMLARMTAAFREWLRPKLADGSYFGWIVEEEGAAIAGIGMMVIDWPPHPSHPEDARRGYILNVFVEPAHRRKGLAKALMERADAEARQRGLAYLILHATKQGRPLYEQLGWSGTNEMAARR
jgi:GNAT superfamily N-acetyltransferase